MTYENNRNFTSSIGTYYRNIHHICKSTTMAKKIQQFLQNESLLKKSVFVFDFDKTITNGLLEEREPKLENLVRGHKHTTQALLALKKKNIPMCILTAREATNADLENVKEELKVIDSVIETPISSAFFSKQF